MAQFRGGIRGTRGEVTRLGHKSSGFSAFVNGWNIGVEVRARFDEATQQDVIEVYQTGGSHRRSVPADPIATIWEKACSVRKAQS